jgi:hypothetical protein
VPTSKPGPIEPDTFSHPESRGPAGEQPTARSDDEPAVRLTYECPAGHTCRFDLRYETAKRAPWTWPRPCPRDVVPEWTPNIEQVCREYGVRPVYGGRCALGLTLTKAAVISGDEPEPETPDDLLLSSEPHSPGAWQGTVRLDGRPERFRLKGGGDLAERTLVEAVYAPYTPYRERHPPSTPVCILPDGRLAAYDAANFPDRRTVTVERRWKKNQGYGWL